jgi:hypothetical protein
MKQFAFAITILNLLILVVILTKLDPVSAQKDQNKLQVLRGSGLEIVDSLGKIRASISFHAAVHKDGVTYPAGILMRLIDRKGQPSVKIGAAEDGSGISLANESQGYIQLLAKESGEFIKIKTAKGKEQEIRP